MGRCSMQRRCFRRETARGGTVTLPVLLGALFAVAVTTGCTRKHTESGNAAGVPAEVPRTWPQGHTPPLKITDQLVLEIPLQFERSAIVPGHAPRSPFAGDTDRTEAQFDFFLPDFSGYTLQNYHDETNENKVEVVYLHAGGPHEAETDAPGEYPPNMLKRLLEEAFDPAAYEDKYGLRCYRGRTLADRAACYGKRDGSDGEDILLYVPQPPFPPDLFPQIQARYFSREYGGVRIAWRTHVKNLPRWRAIDTQIWKFVAAWKVAAPAPASSSGAGPHP
jgi:hypothetical protein